MGDSLPPLATGSYILASMLCSRSLRALAIGLVCAGTAAGGSMACAVLDPDNPDYGEPPDPSAYDPGRGGNDPYGGYGTGPTRVECPAELKRCSHTITYPDSGESSVELRGDFGGPSTWEAGKAMTRNGGA